jgi:N4-gp56 family major capsid protein
VATTGSAALANEIKALYDGTFYLQGQSLVYWDQFCDLREQMNGERGQTYNFPLIASLQPNTGALDELSDIVAQQLRAAEIVVTLQEFGGAVEITKYAVATSYADVYKQAAFTNGYNLAESLDMVVRVVAGQGSRQFFVTTASSAIVARSGIDGVANPVTSANPHTISSTFLFFLSMLGRSVKMPLYEDGCVVTNFHPFLMYDLIQDKTISTLAQYSHPELLFNGEVAYFSSVRMVVSANAKVFYSAGAVNAGGSTVTTLSAQVNVGDTTLAITSGTNIQNGQWCGVLDGTEPGNSWFETNELFRVISGGTTTSVTGFFLDPGPSVGTNEGGARYAHASGKTFSNSRCVYPIPILGPNSITKICSSFTGPYGETVVTGPFDRLGRFLTFGWYGLLGYARTLNSWLFRGEVGSAMA